MQIAIEDANRNNNKNKNKRKKLILKNQNDIDADVYNVLLERMEEFKRVMAEARNWYTCQSSSC